MSCPDCFKGSIHEGVPRGTTAKIYGLTTYIVEPKDGADIKGIIVIIPDAFGMPFINNQLLADHYAAKGAYRVYLPNFMRGWSCASWVIEGVRKAENSGNFLSKVWAHVMLFGNLLPWFIINNIWSSYPRVTRFFTNLRQAEPEIPVFGAGFCWGGKHLTLLARGEQTANGRPLIDAGFTAHPSLLSFPTDLEKIRMPVSFAIGDKDNLLQHDKVEIIRRVVDAQPEEYKGELRVYPDCSHGFAIRADNKYEEVAKQAAAAEDQCIEWFNSYLKQAEPVE